MASSKAGQALTDDEIREFNAYGNQGLALPEKFHGVVQENINGSRVYRYPTAEETKAADETNAAAAQRQKDDAKLADKVRAEAAARSIPAVPPPPAPPA